MIFVTVGAQMPFDRMCRAVDKWAGERGRNDVFAQIGATAWRPSTIEWVGALAPDQFRVRAESCSAMVAHAGMGSILTALEFGKPILVMPRRGDLRETRNDHQIATARRFRELGKVAVAMDESELSQALDRLDGLTPSERIGKDASLELIAAIRDFIWRGLR